MADEDDINDSADGDWFDSEVSLPMDAKMVVVEEMVVKTEEDDEGWNSEDEVEDFTEGDNEIVEQGKALLALHPNANGTTPRTPRIRYQNPNHCNAL